MEISSNDFRTLRKFSEGITYVTEQMSDLVYNIACKIVQLGQESDSVDVVGETLQIVKVHSHVRDIDYNYLISRSLSDCPILFDRKNKKWGREYVIDTGYLEDPETFYPPNREQKIWFLQHVAEIIKAFTTLWTWREGDKIQLLSQVKIAIEGISEESK